MCLLFKCFKASTSIPISYYESWCNQALHFERKALMFSLVGVFLFQSWIRHLTSIKGIYGYKLDLAIFPLVVPSVKGIPIGNMWERSFIGCVCVILGGMIGRVHSKKAERAIGV